MPFHTKATDQKCEKKFSFNAEKCDFKQAKRLYT